MINQPPTGLVKEKQNIGGVEKEVKTTIYSCWYNLTTIFGEGGSGFCFQKQPHTLLPDPTCFGPKFIIFFLTTPLWGVVCIGETPMGSPYAHMSTPYGGAHTGPLRGPVPTPFGVGIRAGKPKADRVIRKEKLPLTNPRRGLVPDP